MLALTRRFFFNDLLDDFDGFLTTGWAWPLKSVALQREPVPEYEVYRNDGNLIYRFSLPGIDPKDVDVSTANNQLTVKVERKAPDIKKEDWMTKSFSYGRFEQTLQLPKGVDPGAVTATFKNGILEVQVPVPKPSLPKKIEIKQLAEATV
jgi:HSP20 family protein